MNLDRKPEEREKMGHGENFYMNFKIEGGLGVDFVDH